MIFLNGLISSYSATYQNIEVLKLISTSLGHEKSEKKVDYNDIGLREAVTSIQRSGLPCNDALLARLFPLLVSVLSKQFHHLEGKILAAISRFDQDGSNQGIRSSTVKTNRKRPITETPLIPIPEHALLFDTALTAADETASGRHNLTASRTPLSSRRRLFNTPRPQEEDTVFSSTPAYILTPDMESKRQKRMSSVSEVMDSLRADDGQRRLSGLLLTNNASIPPSPAINDDFDVGIDPPSPWDDDNTARLALPPLTSPTEPTVVRTQRREKKLKCLMDKKGKRGIEIDPAKIKGRREWYLEESSWEFSSVRRFTLANVVSDRTSHYIWYSMPAKRPEVRVSVEEPLQDEWDDPYEEYGYDDEHVSVEPIKRPPTVADLISGTSRLSLKQVVEMHVQRPSRKYVSKNFMDLLGLLSAGKATVQARTTLGFSVEGPSQLLIVSAV